MSQALPVNNKASHSVAAAAEVFLEHGEFIRTVIRWNLPDAGEAHDFFHDFFLSLVANPIPPHITNIRSYLYRAILHDIVDTRRRRMIQWSVLQECHVCCRPPAPTNAPDTVVMDREETLKLFDMIERRLSRTEAEAVNLRFREDYTTEEAARRMNIKPRTLSRYLSVGLDKLRHFISEDEEYSHEDA